MKILIVDDDNDNLNLLERLLIKYGHNVISATNGTEALDKLRAEVCDLIISDVLMPIMDGFKFCHEVKKSEKLQNIPFIFCTGTYTDEKDEDLALLTRQLIMINYTA